MSSPQMNDPSITPHGESTFEHVERRLHLSPEEYSTSAELKEWVRKNKDYKYVPPYLLDLWGFEVDVKLFDPEKKPPNAPPKKIFRLFNYLSKQCPTRQL